MSARQHFEALYAAHAGAVRGYAMRRTTPVQADDVVAEVFLIAWRRLDDIPADARVWLLGVARRVLANARRSSARQHAVQSRLEHDIRTRPEHAPAAEQPLTLEPAARQVMDALRSLRESDREALLLIAWEELSHREAARVLGVRESTFGVRLHRAKRRLRQALTNPSATTPDITNPLEAR
ncbi:MAG TPA: sigma-70 family RNA polymerase sigma factor [Solirubrobacteraceae bacterium]|nr:sigma-70 family RNA polymerase sigma factor [Solirubrobacteraceae bacterium]